MSGRPEGSQNRGLTRGKLMEVLRRAGIEHPSPQPSKAQLLELCRIHKIDPNGAKAGASITKFIPVLRPCADKAKGVADKSIEFVPDSDNEEDDDISNEELLLNQEGNSLNMDPITLAVCNQHTNYQQQPLNDRPGWYPELINFGYATTGITAPNKAVQTLLGCIMIHDLHKVFIAKECSLADGKISAILFLGFNKVLDLVCSFKSADYNRCKDLIEKAYLDLPAAHILADSNDIFDLRAFIKGLTALEKANSLKISYPINDDSEVTKEIDQTPPVLDNCLFDISMVPHIDQGPVIQVENREQVNSSEEDKVKEELLKYNIKELNLFNCGPFPIMSNRNMEIHGEQFQHTLWLSRNLGVIAPISKESLIKLARLQPDEVKKAESNALAFIKPFKRIDIQFPFKLDFLGRTCELGTGLHLHSRIAKKNLA